MSWHVKSRQVSSRLVKARQGSSRHVKARQGTSSLVQSQPKGHHLQVQVLEGYTEDLGRRLLRQPTLLRTRVEGPVLAVARASRAPAPLTARGSRSPGLLERGRLVEYIVARLMREALSGTQHALRGTQPPSGAHRKLACFTRPVSMTTVTSSMVSEVSATLVARMTLRCEGGGR